MTKAKRKMDWKTIICFVYFCGWRVLSLDALTVRLVPLDAPNSVQTLNAKQTGWSSILSPACTHDGKKVCQVFPSFGKLTKNLLTHLNNNILCLWSPERRIMWILSWLLSSGLRRTRLVLEIIQTRSQRLQIVLFSLIKLRKSIFVRGGIYCIGIYSFWFRLEMVAMCVGIALFDFGLVNFM